MNYDRPPTWKLRKWVMRNNESTLPGLMYPSWTGTLFLVNTLIIVAETEWTHPFAESVFSFTSPLTDVGASVWADEPEETEWFSLEGPSDPVGVIFASGHLFFFSQLSVDLGLLHVLSLPQTFSTASIAAGICHYFRLLLMVVRESLDWPSFATRHQRRNGRNKLKNGKVTQQWSYITYYIIYLFTSERQKMPFDATQTFNAGLSQKGRQVAS